MLRSLSTSLALRVIRERGVARSRDLEAAGLSRTTIMRLAQAGVIERIGRGLYRVSDDAFSPYTALAAATRGAPKGVICLLSALHLYELTLTLPDCVWLALPRGTKRPALPVRYEPVWMSPDSLAHGCEVRHFDGHEVRLTTPPKTVADCFKYRTRIGLDVALEALRLYRAASAGTLDELWEAAARCRVQTVIRPYLEALL
jgi:predicted transcriptional regulator of viral defense system